MNSVKSILQCFPPEYEVHGAEMRPIFSTIGFSDVVKHELMTEAEIKEHLDTSSASSIPLDISPTAPSSSSGGSSTGGSVFSGISITRDFSSASSINRTMGSVMRSQLERVRIFENFVFVFLAVHKKNAEYNLGAFKCDIC